jgi:hypothetical protein
VAPFSRPGILVLPSDGDDSGSVLGNGEFYRGIDASPFPVEFRADVSGIDGDKADVRIRYGTNGRPDPSIRPWPASPQRPWQSPDIEVRNAKSAADPQWSNVPWVGNPNTVVAKIKNGGNVMAPGVRVNFLIKNFNIGGAPEVALGSDVRDVPAAEHAIVDRQRAVADLRSLPVAVLEVVVQAIGDAHHDSARAAGRRGTLLDGMQPDRLVDRCAVGREVERPQPRRLDPAEHHPVRYREVRERVVVVHHLPAAGIAPGDARGVLVAEAEVVPELVRERLVDLAVARRAPFVGHGDHAEVAVALTRRVRTPGADARVGPRRLGGVAPEAGTVGETIRTVSKSR